MLPPLVARLSRPMRVIGMIGIRHERGGLGRSPPGGGFLKECGQKGTREEAVEPLVEGARSAQAAAQLVGLGWREGGVASDLDRRLVVAVRSRKSTCLAGAEGAADLAADLGGA